MTARAEMISQVTASRSEMCGVLLSYFFINFAQVTQVIILPALTETLFFSSIDSFFLLFLFLLRTNLRSNLNAFHKNLESTNLLNLRTTCLCNYCQS